MSDYLELDEAVHCYTHGWTGELAQVDGEEQCPAAEAFNEVVGEDRDCDWRSVYVTLDGPNPRETETRCGECGGHLSPRSFLGAPNITHSCDSCGTRHGSAYPRNSSPSEPIDG